MGQKNIVEVRGLKIAWEVNGDGIFSAKTPTGDELKADTIEKLKAKLSSAIRSPIAIPFVRWSKHEHKLERGTVTGKHAANGNWLAKIDGQKHGEQMYGLSNCFQLSPEKELEYMRLHQAADAAHDALEMFENANNRTVRGKADEALANGERD